jgi:nitrate reductase beta subunit
MRAHMRRINLGEPADPSIAAVVGMTPEEIEAMYRLLAIAKYEDRYVIPPAHVELAGDLEELPGCSVDYSSRGEPVLISIGEVTVRPAAAETFDLARRRAAADKFADIGPGASIQDAR